MGCTMSNFVIRDLPGKQLDTYVTSEEVRLVKQSWSIVKQDMESVGVLMFQKLFEMQEQLKKLFTSLMIPNGQSYLIDEEKLRQHAVIVMEGLGAAVESLEDSIYLTNLLIAMGERHYNYKVRPDMLGYLWPAVRDTLKEKLGEDCSEDVERAWSHVFEYVANKFQEGIRRGKQNHNKADGEDKEDTTS